MVQLYVVERVNETSAERGVKIDTDIYIHGSESFTGKDFVDSSEDEYPVRIERQLPESEPNA